MKSFSSEQTTDLAHLRESRQTQKGIISAEQNKLQSRSGEEADHGGVMMSFILWNVPCIHMLVLSLCSNPRFYYKNLYLIDSIQNNLLERDIVNIVLWTFGHAYILGVGGICQVFADKS